MTALVSRIGRRPGAALLLIGLLGLPFGASAFHYDWDQGHDVFDPLFPLLEEPPSEPEQCSASDPVNLRSGEYRESDTAHDLAFPGLGPILALRFTYHSRDRYAGPFGHGWHTNLTRRAIVTTDGVDAYVICRQGNGQRKRFERQADGRYEPPPGTFSRLQVADSGIITLRGKHGTVRTFDADGRMTAVTDRNGNSLQIDYNAAGVIRRATGASGRTLTFDHGPNGRIAAVVDPAGQRWRYRYSAGR